MTEGTATTPAVGSSGGTFRDALFRWRGWAVILLGAAVVVWRWPLVPELPFVLAALPLVLGGVAMRVWSRSYFTRGSDTRRIQAHRFVCWGPYRRVRNPLYVGNLGVAVGLALAFAGPWAAAAFLVALLVLYTGVIRSEEAVLAGTYGESYARFRLEVPRWIPRWRALPADPEAPRAELGHALRKETQRIAGAVGAWVLALVLALVIR
jgi:protein-S-isoprenylcysteine O-methyltransferase Ste14